MNCPACSSANDDGARFCSTCGQPLAGLSEERRVVTVLFADLVGFTTLSEHRDPEAVKRLVDSAFQRLVRDVTTFGGRVDKILGDAIVALFGAPVAHEDDAERAVRAAMRMQATLATYGAETGIDIRMRVGVNTGEVLVGALRAGGDYTAMGDVVNLASRLQTAATPGEVVVGDATHTSTEEAIAYEARGHLTARGREQSEAVWAATGALRPPGPTRRTARTPLIGRDTELNVLLNAARGSIRRGRAQLMVLMGEAGVGKTRLAEEMALTLRSEDGIAAYEGRCLPYGEVNPWGPIADVLRDALCLDRDAGIDETVVAVRAAVQDVLDVSMDADRSTADGADELESERAAAADEMVDGLLHVLGHEGQMGVLDGSSARSAASRALISFMEGLVERRPMVVRIADLHWADETVFALIDEMSSRLSRRPLVMVATARRVLQERWTIPSGRFNSIVLNVDPLDRDSAVQLLGHLTTDHLDGPSTDVLLDRSGGNPFYLEELVTLLDRADGSPIPDEVGQLPETLRGLVAARIDALSTEEQAVLGDAAVWGTSGALLVLDRIAEAARGISSVAPEVQSLAQKDVLVVVGQRWSFRSDLVREVTYGRLTKYDRLRGHAGIAEYLDRMMDAQGVDDSMVETVTRHVTEAAVLAGDVGGDGRRDELTRRALYWLSEAVRRAERGASWPYAVRLQGRVLDLAGDDPEVRASALLGRSRAHAEQWEHEEAMRDALEALGLAAELESPAIRADALQRLAAAHMRSGDFAAGDDALAEALAINDAADNVAGRGEALRQQGLSYLLRGDHRAAEVPILGALEAFRSVQDRRGEGWAFQSLAWIAFADGRIERSGHYVEAAHDAFSEVGDRGGLHWTLGLTAFIHLARGEFDDARDLAQRVLNEADRRGDRFGMGMMHTVLGGVELWTGHPRSAVISAGHALSHLDAQADAVGVELALTVEGRALVMCGDVDAGLAALHRSLDVGTLTNTRFAASVAALTEVQLGLPGILLAGDDGAETLPPASGALRLLFLGRPDEADEMLAEAEVDLPADRAAAAVVDAAVGRVGPALERGEGVEAMPEATYNDAVLVAVVRSLLDPSAAGAAELADARFTLETTQDSVMRAVVDIADGIRTARGWEDSSTSWADVEQRLAELSLGRTRWLAVLSAMADNAPAQQSDGMTAGG